MKRWLPRILAVVVGTALTSGAILAYACWKNPYAYQDIRDRAREAWIQYRAEGIGDLAKAARADHDWAGVYGTAPWGDTLFLSPAGDFALYRDSMCGTCARWIGCGRLRLLGDRKVALEPAVASDPYELYEQPLLLVPWGDLAFAVPERRIQEFCEQAADHQFFPGFWVRPVPEAFSEAAIPPGLPEVPEPYARFLD